MRVLIFLTMFCFSVCAQEMEGTVTAIIDGNTIEFQTHENDVFKFVLADIDCPELEQDFGLEAKVFLEKLLTGKISSITVEGKDRLGNRVGVLRYKGRDPRLDLLARGLAWTAEKKPELQLEQLKEVAKSSGKGLWKQENPTPPWVFRRQQTMLVAKSS